MSRKKTKEEFIVEARKIHGEKYNYEKSAYKSTHSKMLIVCPIHGDFSQAAHEHLKGQGCPKCKAANMQQIKCDSTGSFIEKAQNIHGKQYSYEQVEYKDSKTPVIIICSIHGKFFQKPNDHLNRCGCPKCAIENKKKTLEEFIKESKLLHGDKYDYSKVNYINTETKVCITCPRHGNFWMTPHNHLQHRGCPKCKQSKMEIFVEKCLKDNGVEYETQKKFEWLGKQRLDFYLPHYKTAIECQGIQHFIPTDFGNKLKSSEEIFEEIRRRDKTKNDKCRKNDIKLLYFTFLKEKTFLGEKIFSDFSELLTMLKQPIYS